MKTYTVGDLRNVPAGTFQFCRECCGEYSANHGDYVFAERGDKTRLTCCGQPVALVRRVSELVDAMESR